MKPKSTKWIAIVASGGIKAGRIATSLSRRGAGGEVGFATAVIKNQNYSPLQ